MAPQLQEIFLNKNRLLDTNEETCLKVCLINGMIMGGGAGLSMNGKFRVVTENTIFAMPEASLGLFPDVGASYFLSRLSGFFGEYIGLTGKRLDGAEMVACGLATHFVLSTNLPLLEEELNKVDSSDLTIISTIIDAFSLTSILKEDSVYRRMDIINKCFSKGTVEEILSALEYEAINKTDDWIVSAVKSLKTSSPMGLKVFLKSIREGRTQGIDQCLIREYKMACHALRRTVTDDFFEGCRAALFDKDKKPKWEPSKLELVSKEMVDQYFIAVDSDDWEELQLPIRSNSTKLATAKL
ncbi:probable 3-hydroxyisobutyryl-CoA hydrolase 2 isoform X2 [Magnolia sinica]|uniref:probable 3-hydroxyisobutyryl-CoA hydrolase 2 isoform X2 n=2 Tax=Magnolia sinica TaxID=86752 RepID=UPI00265AC3C6|nr:probable 3-hydroxyisobutyryl-CoA hydrolase 2 isoform X2 [Magnolia sinica]